MVSGYPETIRQSVDDLVAALMRRALADPSSDQRLAQAFAKTGRSVAARTINSRIEAWWYRLLIGSGYRMFRTGRRGLSRMHLTSIPAALRQLGFSIRQTDPSTESELNKFIQQAAHEVRGSQNAQSAHHLPKPPEVPTQDWRIVEHVDLTRRVWGSLKNRSVAGLVGMSGSGKTVLAGQVAKYVTTHETSVEWIDCNEEHEGALELTSWSVDEHLLVAEKVIKAICKHLPERFSDKRLEWMARDKMREVAEEWQLISSDQSDRPVTPDSMPSEIRVALSSLDWKRLVGSLKAPSTRLLNPILLKSVSRILSLVPSDVLVVVDNPKNFQRSTTFIEKLFLVEGTPNSAKRRLLVLSTDKACVEHLNGFIIDLDEELAPGRNSKALQFARDIIVSAAATGPPALAPSAASKRVVRFKRQHLSQKITRQRIDDVIVRLRGHALALSSIGTAWRHNVEDESFWEAIGPTLDSHATHLLSLSAASGLLEGHESRHLDVLGSLRVNWSLLAPETQDRYLDLGITPSGGSIDRLVFQVFWRNVTRGGCRGTVLPRIMQAHQDPLALFHRTSLLQKDSRSGRYVLHDLHRLMIQAELGSPGLARRHREFLVFCGICTSKFKFALGRAATFDRDADGRMAILPPFAKVVSKQELALFNSYIPANLFHHIKQGGSDTVRRGLIVKCLTSFEMLQSLLDAKPRERQSKFSTPIQGNVELLLSSLWESNHADVRAVRAAVQFSSRILSRDRTQLGAQLKARLPAKSSSSLARLIAAVARRCSDQQMFPRFMLLSSRSLDLVGNLDHGEEVLGTADCSLPTGNLTILVWSRRLVRAWDPERGSDDILCSFGEDNHLISLIPHSAAAGGTSILTCTSDGEVRAMDLKTRRAVKICKLDLRRGMLCGLGVIDYRGRPAIFTALRQRRQISCAVWQLKQRGSRLYSLNLTGGGRLLHADWVQDGAGKPTILLAHEGGFIALFDVTKETSRGWLPQPSNKIVVRGASWIPPGLINKNGAVLGWSQARVWTWDAITGDVANMRTAENSPLEVVSFFPSVLGRPGVIARSSFNIDRFRVFNIRPGGPVHVRVLPALNASDDAIWIDRGAKGGYLVAWRPTGLIRGDSGKIQTELGRVSVFSAVKQSRPWGLLDRDTYRDWAADSSAFLFSSKESRGVRIEKRSARDGERVHGFSLQHTDYVATAAWIDRRYGGPAVVTLSRGAIRTWDGRSGKRLCPPMRRKGDILGFRWIPDRGEPSLLYQTQEEVGLFAAKTGRHIKSVTFPDFRILNASWIKASSTVVIQALGNSTGEVRIWNPKSGIQDLLWSVSALFDNDFRAGWISLSGGHFLVVGEFRDTIRVWDSRSRAERELLDLNAAGLTEKRRWVGGPPDSQWFRRRNGDICFFLMIGSLLHCYNAATGAPELHSPIGHKAEVRGLYSAVTAEHGDTVLSWAGNSVYVRQLNGNKFRTVSSCSHDDLVKGARWIPGPRDGRKMLTWSYDGTVRLWNANEGAELSRFSVHATEFSVVHLERNSVALDYHDGSFGVFDIRT